MELSAVALGRHEHGRYGYDRVADDPIRHGSHGADGYAVAGNGIRFRVRHVDRDDGRLACVI